MQKSTQWQSTQCQSTQGDSPQDHSPSGRPVPIEGRLSPRRWLRLVLLTAALIAMNSPATAAGQRFAPDADTPAPETTDPDTAGPAAPDPDALDANALDADLEVRHVLPDIQTRGGSSSMAASVLGRTWTSRLAPTGMEGWGESVVSIQNRTLGTNTYQYEFAPLSGAALTGSSGLAEIESANIVLEELPDAIESFYSGRLETSAEAGIVAFTKWSAGGALAYEAPEFTADELILPLMARGLNDYSTTYYIATQSRSEESGGPNFVVSNIYDPVTGSMVSDFAESLRPGDIVAHNLDYEPVFTRLTANRPDGAYMGALTVDAQAPIAIIAYGEDAAGRSSSAYRARPSAAADRVQLLPVVRSGVGGDSLIAVTNVTDSAAEVQITFTGAMSEPDMAGQRERQSLSIPGRGTSFIDLGELGRGSADAVLPRRPFIGSAVIESTEPILAVVQDHHGMGANALRAGAYNALSPSDLSAQVGTPRILHSKTRRSRLFVSTVGGPASVEVTFLEGDTPVGTVTASVERDAVVAVDPSDAGVPLGRTLRAVVTADRPIGIVVQESDLGGSGDALDASVWTGFPIVGGQVSPTPITPTARPSETETPTATPTESATVVPTDTAPIEIRFTVYLPACASEKP